ncbi:MAG: hypothetical protein AAB114_04030, partial [Chloroflexota bacterium]
RARSSPGRISGMPVTGGTTRGFTWRSVARGLGAFAAARGLGAFAAARGRARTRARVGHTMRAC